MSRSRRPTAKGFKMIKQAADEAAHTVDVINELARNGSNVGYEGRKAIASIVEACANNEGIMSCIDTELSLLVQQGITLHVTNYTKPKRYGHFIMRAVPTMMLRRRS